MLVIRGAYIRGAYIRGAYIRDFTVCNVYIGHRLANKNIACDLCVDCIKLCSIRLVSMTVVSVLIFLCDLLLT